MTESRPPRPLTELEAARADARRWQMIAEQRATDCDHLRAICASYERDTVRHRERVESLQARINALLDGSVTP